jgi:periplasmic divalent cation tolerance protein
MMMIKTRKSLTKELSDFVNARHPYDVPEVLTADVSDGNKAYLDWLQSSTKGGCECED